MAYPGNTSLSQDIQQRILNTFRQTLQLAGKGKTDEANLGCDFIIRMDPHFTPARTLQQRLREGGAVEVDDLRTQVFGAEADPEPPVMREPSPAPPAPESQEPPAKATGESSFADLNELELDLGDDEPAPAVPRGGGSSPLTADELRARFEGYLQKRRFQEVLDLAGDHSALVEGDAALRALVETARTRIEAEPYLRSFLESARQRLDEGDRAEAERLLDKARNLDPTHPELVEFSGPERVGEVEHVDIAFGPKPATGPKPETQSEPTAGSGDGGDRIAALVEEGQAAFDRGDYQAAIDSWSRIFLIDIDNREANRRIDEARRLKAEQDRRLEEAYHAGLDHLEAGREDEARTAFEQVLDSQPGHLAAKDQLERLRGGAAPAEAEAPPQVDDLDLEEPAESTESSLKEEIFVPPDPGKRGEAASATEARRGERPGAAPRPWQAFAAVGGVVLVLALAGSWLLWSNWDRFFPNAVDAPEPAERRLTQAPAPDALERARGLHEEGRTAAAIAQLRRLPPNDPAFREAQALIAEWETAEQARPDGHREGPTEEELDRREALIADARDAYGQREYLLAEDRFSRAAEIAPLEGTARDLHQDATYQVEHLARERELIRQGEWAMALPSLWRQYERDPTDRDVVRLLVDSHHNLGVRDLQRQAPERALEHFKDALSLRPADEELQRHYLFALSYQDRPPDLLYRIYVKYLRLR